MQSYSKWNYKQKPFQKIMAYVDTGNTELKVFEKTWQIISINIYLQTTAENSPTQF